MKKIINIAVISLIALVGLGVATSNAFAEGEEAKPEESKTSLTLSPVSQTLDISSESSYDGVMSVTNDGNEEVQIEVYAAPYSYVYSDEDDTYKLGFSQENNFTQITRWITIQDPSGNYDKRPKFTIKPKEKVDIKYKINTPPNIPAGGQYAVLFAQTITGKTNESGIKTEASAGMVIYGHSTEGEAIATSEMRDVKIGQGLPSSETKDKDNFYGLAKVKNTGNVDFFAKGTLKVDPIIGFSSYETPRDQSIISIIPESERIVEDEWTETPDFGIYKVTWTVRAGDNEEVREQIFFLIPPYAVILFIIFLTIIIGGTIIVVKKRKERNSRLSV